MNKSKEEEKIIQTTSDSKIYNVGEEFYEQVVENTADIIDLKANMALCIDRICENTCSAQNTCSAEDTTNELTISSSLSNSEANISLPDIELSDDDDEIINPLVTESIIDKELHERLLVLRDDSNLDIYSDSYYDGLNLITKKIYKFWFKKHENQKFSIDQYISWEKFATKERLFELNWPDDEFKKVINWLFIKYKNGLIADELHHDLIQKSGNNNYLTSKDLCEFNTWWKKKLVLKEQEFKKNKEIDFDDKDYTLNKKRIIWFMICENDLSIKKYFRLKKIQFADEDIDEQKNLEIKNMWNNILWENFSEYIYDTFILNQKNNNQENVIKCFLDSMFKKLKIIFNKNKISSFFGETLLELDNNEFTNSLFKEQKLMDVHENFISFASNNISKFDNFILENHDQVKIFNNWLWKNIATQFIKDYSHNIFKNLKNIISDSEINELVDKIEIKIQEDNMHRILSKEPNKNLEKIMSDIKVKIQELIQRKLKSNNFLEDNDLKISQKEAILIEERLQQVLYKIGRENKDYASDVIVEYYIKYSNLKENGIKKYYELDKKGKNILIKYNGFLPIAINYMKAILKDYPDFKSKCDTFSDDVILFFSDRVSLRERLNKRSSSLLEHTERFNEINNFLIKSKINEDVIKDITKTDHNNIAERGVSNTTSVSYMKIPKNDEIREAVEKYFLEAEVAKINKESLKESVVIWIENFTTYWNEVKMWIEKYYLPPQIYFNWINNFIYLPIERIYHILQINFTSYSNNSINKVLEAISCLSEDIANTIYNQFINKKNEYLDQIKHWMNIELSLESTSLKSVCSNANNFTFLYDHLLRNIYLTIKDLKANKKLVDSLNFKGLHRRNSINMSCFGSPCTSTSMIPEPVVKHLEYLNLDFKGSINETRTIHGCKEIRITNKSICNSVSSILMKKKQLFKLLQLQNKNNKKK